MALLAHYGYKHINKRSDIAITIYTDCVAMHAGFRPAFTTKQQIKDYTGQLDINCFNWANIWYPALTSDTEFQYWYSKEKAKFIKYRSQVVDYMSKELATLDSAND